LYCCPSFKFLLSLQDVELETRFSALWWPVEDEFQGSKNVRDAGAAPEEEREGLCVGEGVEDCGPKGLVWQLGMNEDEVTLEGIETSSDCDTM
jgi:hypothetical protein